MKPPPKISILSPTLCKGGVDRAYILAQALQKLGCQTTIFGFLFNNKISPPPPPDITVKAFRAGLLPGILKSSSNLLQQIDGDMIYAVKPKPTSFGMALLNKLWTNRTLLLDMDDWELSWCGGEQWKYRPSFKQLVRDLFNDTGLRNLSHPFYLQQLEKFISQASALTVDTSFLQQRFGGVYLPNGRDTNLFNPEKFDAQASRLRYGLEGYRVLMFPGAARPHKGLEDVLVALDLLNHKDYKLVLVGENPYDNYDQTLMARWGRWLLQLPEMPVQEMPAVLAAADVVVVPQRNQPIAMAQFPIKLTEGMAMAKPVLATKVGDIPTILAETGFLVEASQPEQIAATLEEIFQDLDRAKQRGAMARKRCIENYSLEAMATILEGVFGRL